MSGDLTRRTRIGECRAARAFLDALDPAWLAVPGNHDTPLDNLFVRLLRPWHRYRRHIHDDLAPVWADGEIGVAGVNTANPFSWQRGRVVGDAVDRLCRAFEGHERGRMHVAVLHHPLEHGADIGKRPMRGAREALRRVGECGVDIVLSGHLHSWHARPFEKVRAVLFVQAGTSLSTRHRGEPNDFNLPTLANDRVGIEQWTARDAPVFSPNRSVTFEKTDGVRRHAPTVSRG